MDSMKEKLVELLSQVQYLGGLEEKIADHLIANGVTFATDNNVGDKLTPTEPLTMSMKHEKGYQPFGLEGFKKACPTCKNSGTALCRKCKMEVESGYDPKDGYGMTNADRIRSMSDEELCEFLSQYVFYKMCDEGCDACTYSGDCDKRLLEWLKQPAEGE